MRAADGTIAGSALRIDQAVRNYMSYADISFEQAVIAATHAPAKLIGLEGEMGRIAPGLRADLSFWDAEYKIMGTMVGGTVVYGLARGERKHSHHDRLRDRRCSKRSSETSFRRDFAVRLWDGTTLPSTHRSTDFTLWSIRRARCAARLHHRSSATPAPTFVAGGLDVTGDLTAAIARLNAANDHDSALQKARHRTDAAASSARSAPRTFGRRLHGRLHSRKRDRAAISYHYDHPVDFYRTFLDRDLVYSCAYFDDGVDDARGRTASQTRLRAG